VEKKDERESADAAGRKKGIEAFGGEGGESVYFKDLFQQGKGGASFSRRGENHLLGKKKKPGGQVAPTALSRVLFIRRKRRESCPILRSWEGVVYSFSLGEGLITSIGREEGGNCVEGRQMSIIRRPMGEGEKILPFPWEKGEYEANQIVFDRWVVEDVVEKKEKERMVEGETGMYA